MRQLANQRPSNGHGTSYTGISETSPNISNISNPKLLSYKDLEFIFPSDNVTEQNLSKPNISNISNPKLLNYKDLEFLLPTDPVREQNLSKPFESIKSEKDPFTKNLEKLPKSYELLNKDLEFSKFNDEEVPKELEKLISRVSSSIDEDNCSVNLKSLSETYRNQEDNEKLDLLKKFRNSLKPNKDDEDRLKLLDKLIEKLLNPDDSRIAAKETISHLEGLKTRLKDIPKRYNKSPDSLKKSIIDVNSNKIIIKTTRKLPSKVYTTCNNRETKQLVKEKKIRPFPNDYKSNLEVFGVSNKNKANIENMSQINNPSFLNNSYSINYSLKPFETISPSEQIASVDQINKFQTVFNTGVKSKDILQIHPLSNSKSNMKSKIFFFIYFNSKGPLILLSVGSFPAFILALPAIVIGSQET